MLASSTNVFLSFNAFSRHPICSAGRLRLRLRSLISFPRFSSQFSGPNTSGGTLEYDAAASPDGHLIETPITDAAAVDSTIFRTLSSRQKEQISVFVSALLEWNEAHFFLRVVLSKWSASMVLFCNFSRWLLQRMNLTSERQEGEVMERHVEDSLALLTPLRRSYLSRCCPSSFPSCDGLKLVDVGSGSGFPGLILAIACPTWNVTLLESMQKRCFFLEHVVRFTGLSNVKVLRERAENVGQSLDFRELFDVAVARAVAEMRILAEYCLPLVRVGGLFIAAKGHNPQEEIRNSEKAIQLMGGSMVELCTAEYILGKANLKRLFLSSVESYSPLGQRTAVICVKELSTPKKYPRKTGIPSKFPL
ncbi:hypothetical protein IEQ34_009582 [Dendrobium chrysotoxum]|uniref:Ribosomal RNA small subunit methyltransferase G n=1 Tax=Dendrobium chrysotoxum TaxID=161865 RepID=A0AAV7H107_DENCH|nr:hypothetical protein IEQ34_009582 [Dendrobium chrysotoxum]